MPKFMITGAAGFIGSAVCRKVISEGLGSVVAVDKLTYAGNINSLDEVRSSADFKFEKADICDAAQMQELLALHQPDIIMNLAAESHVDRSIDGPSEFIQTNIVGTYTLLEAARSYYEGLEDSAREKFRFHQISTDEVYGELPLNDDKFSETTPYAPSSPYSASKAASDHLAMAWHHTYGLPVVLSNCSNNYGSHQFPEKLIPLMIINCLEEKPLPIYGRGENVRDWLHVDDHASALLLVATEGKLGETYNIGGDEERSNLEVVEKLCTLLDAKMPRANGEKYYELVAFTKDRPGHDLRYAIDASKIKSELGWSAKESFDSGMAKTVDWYLGRKDWWGPIRSGNYDGARIGNLPS